MSTKLVQLENRITELEDLASEVDTLAKAARDGMEAQPQLATKGQQWYRGARALLESQKFSGLTEFDTCYDRRGQSFTDIQSYINRDFLGRDKFRGKVDANAYYSLFSKCFLQARSLLQAVVQEIRSRELPVRTQLSFDVAASEFETAQYLLDEARGDEALTRASGVIGRVALERYLFTVADSRSIAIVVNPPTKKKPGVEDVLQTLLNANVLTGIQKSELDGLFKVGNNCAHPKEVVRAEDVERLIVRGRELASVIL